MIPLKTGQYVLLHLQIYDQHLIYFSFAANMNELTNDKSNYTFEKPIVVSVWEYEQPHTWKSMKHAWEIFHQGFG